MNILAIDTSTKYLCVGISRNSKLVLNYKRDVGHQLSRDLVPTIKRLVSKAGVRLDDIDIFGVGIGPGSFTGLRIGISTILGINFALKRPIIGVSSLDIISRNAFVSDSAFVCPVLDAKRGLVYTCIYKRRNSKLIRAMRYLLIEPKKLSGMIKKDTVLLGDGVDMYKGLLRKKHPKTLKFLKEDSWFPEAGNLVHLVQEKVKNKSLARYLKKSIVPLYLYPKECQIRK